MNPVNAEQVKQRKELLTDADKSHLNELRLKYILVAHCNMKDTPIDADNDDADNDNCATNKCCSVSLDQNADGQGGERQQESLEASLSKNKRMCTYHIGTSKFAVDVPRQVHIQSSYSHTQLLSRLKTFEAENNRMREKIHELENVHKNETNEIEKLTLKLGNAQITIDSLESHSIELSSCHDSEICIITAKLSKLEELVTEMKSEINNDQIKVKIGNIMLNLPPHSAKKWKETWNAKN